MIKQDNCKLLTFSSVKYLSSFKYSWSGKWVLGVLRSRKLSIKACQNSRNKILNNCWEPLIKHCIIDVDNDRGWHVENRYQSIWVEKDSEIQTQEVSGLCDKAIRNYKIKPLLLKQLCSFLLAYTVTMHLTSSMHDILDLMKYRTYESLLCARHRGARKRHK